MGAPPAPHPSLGEQATSEELKAAASAFAKRAQATGRASSGHHNRNYVAPLSQDLAGLLGVEPHISVTVRVRRPEALAHPVVIRTWNEAEILRALGNAPESALSYTPRCLFSGDDFTILSYVEGVPLSTLCPDNKHMDTVLIEAQTGLLARMTQVPLDSLPPLPLPWQDRKDGDSEGFLRDLMLAADEQICKPNWAAFGDLFTAFGIPDDVFLRLADDVPAMARRPYSLLHADLHRDNLIVSYGGEPPLICVDWELATYGDPLHDLATHLVRTRYRREQWDGVVGWWMKDMLTMRPAAVDGVAKDLGHYLDFERAQSVFPDIMRAARSLEGSYDQKSLDEATTAVHLALEAAEEPLKLRNMPEEREIEQTLSRWRSARRVGPRRRGRRSHGGARIHWEPDRHFPVRPDFPAVHIRDALAREVKAPVSHVFSGSGHLNTVVRLPDFGAPVVVRRELPRPRAEGSHLSEHAVLRAIEESGAAVAAPRVLAVGANRPWYPFSIHTYESPRGHVPPGHPVGGLSPQQASALIDQFAAVTEVDGSGVDPVACEEGFSFSQWLKDQLVDLVGRLPRESRQLAEILGLPDAEALRETMRPWEVGHREPALVHGNLNPWNLVRRDDGLELTMIDWDMALVGDPLYDLVRHMYLTPTTPEIRELMLERWRNRLDPVYTRGMSADWPVYWRMETVRSAYVDLDRLVTGMGLHAPNVRRAVDTYASTLLAATTALGLPTRWPENPYLAFALR